MLSVPKIVIPLDVIDIELFFKDIFTGCPKEVFARFCKFHDLDVEDTLQSYSSSLRWNLIYPENKSKNLTEEMESLNQCFFMLLR